MTLYDEEELEAAAARIRDSLSGGDEGDSGGGSGPRQPRRPDPEELIEAHDRLFSNRPDPPEMPTGAEMREATRRLFGEDAAGPDPYEIIDEKGAGR